MINRKRQMRPNTLQIVWFPNPNTTERTRWRIAPVYKYELAGLKGEENTSWLDRFKKKGLAKIIIGLKGFKLVKYIVNYETEVLRVKRLERAEQIINSRYKEYIKEASFCDGQGLIQKII